ncbi:unnamed protein product [Ascophyllum nodosum]
MEKATRRWKKTFEWRKENKVDEIIHTPQPHFHQCREIFPVYVHGRSRKGMPVLWDLIGKFDLPKADRLNFDLTLLTPYYVFLNECIWRVLLDKGENDDDLAKFITVEDVSGVQLRHLTSRFLKVIKALTGTMKEHYVERCHKTYIINAPKGSATMWRLVAPMLGSRTRKKVTILGKDYLKTMEKEIDISQIPVQYGGRSERAIDDSDDERKIQSLVKRLNVSSGGDEGEI